MDGGYMFGIYMIGVNFSNPYKKIFDVVLTHVTYGPMLSKLNSTRIPLEKCT